MGANINPVIAPSMNKIGNVKPITQTNRSQARDRHNAPNQMIFKHISTETYTDRMANVKRPIYDFNDSLSQTKYCFDTLPKMIAKRESFLNLHFQLTHEIVRISDKRKRI